MKFVPWPHFLNSHTNGLVQFVDVRKLMSSSQVTKWCQELPSNKNNTERYTKWNFYNYNNIQSCCQRSFECSKKVFWFRIHSARANLLGIEPAWFASSNSPCCRKTWTLIFKPLIHFVVPVIRHAHFGGDGGQNSVDRQRKKKRIAG